MDAGVSAAFPPSMNAEQFDLINRLFQLTFQMGDRLGSESSDPAQLLLTHQPSLAASRIYFPSDYTYEMLDGEVWNRYISEVSPLAQMADLLQPYPLTCGIYRQDAVSWWVCAFWLTQENLGTNMLLRAHRVET